MLCRKPRDRRRPAIATLLATAFQIAVFHISVFLVSPVAVADGADPRLGLAVTATERAYILEQMRLFVTAVQAITEALATGNTAAVAVAAAARGRRENAHDPNFPQTLSARLPPLWKQMGGATRGGFDALADAARAGAPKEKSLAILAATLRQCVACHQTYRLGPAAP